MSIKLVMRAAPVATTPAPVKVETPLQALVRVAKKSFSHDHVARKTFIRVMTNDGVVFKEFVVDGVLSRRKALEAAGLA